jgi:hypothetical protein
MSDDKSEQESRFNLEAIKDSIDRMKPELSACSRAAHKAKDAEDSDDPEFDRVAELGSLVQCLGEMCGPHIMLLHEIAHALDEVHEAEEEQERRHHRHH